ncbi:MAG TPA: DEAD/DEAH box helicase [Burkholderiales bacterium]|nr:DEAD/DEAH box helicase [Burkholderiales bacterium]
MTSSFNTLGLSAEILRAVNEQGYTQPTPVQAQAIPVIIEGRDVMAGAQTGTGKTAGFTLPMLQRLSINATSSTSPAKRPVRALILTPTRELAAQVHDSVRAYGKYLRLKSTMIYGGVGMRPQIDALRRGVDIVVATPGRLLDHVQQRTIDLSKVELLVLDEADRMLDMGFIHDIKRVMALLRKDRQNVLFSATFSGEIRKLADSLLNDPVVIEVARRNQESELITQRIHPVDHARKRELLTHLISEGEWQQVLVFARTKHGADRLADQLSRANIEAAAIHGNKSQGQRTRALAQFKRGAVRVLVATDIAARGIDIEELPHVVNYELPNVAEDYVHRIGRTGRAGSSGMAVSLVSREEAPLMRDIERLLKRKLDREIVVGFEPTDAFDPAALPNRRPQGRKPQGGRPNGGKPGFGKSSSGKPGFGGKPSFGGDKPAFGRHNAGGGKPRTEGQRSEHRRTGGRPQTAALLRGN